MNHEHRKISLAERLIVTLGVGISLAVMAVVLIRMASTGAHPVAVCLMAAALVGALGPKGDAVARELGDGLFKIKIIWIHRLCL